MAAVGFRFSEDEIQRLNRRASDLSLGRFPFRAGEFFYYCSGTLIGTHTVVLAGHCVDQNLNPFFTSKELSRFLQVPLEEISFVQLGGRLIGTSDVFLHPDYVLQDDPMSSEIIKLCGPICMEIIDAENSLFGGPVFLTRNDVAVFTLAEEVNDIVPFSLTRTEPQVGNPIVIVGYGATNQPGFSIPDGSDPGSSLEGVNFISAFDENRVFFFFDHESESDTCVGDSGGPLFSEYGFGAVLVGITSGGTSTNCKLGDIAWNERADIHVDWINEVSNGNVFQVLN